MLHQDYTTDEIKLRIQKYFKEKADEYGQRHFQIVKYAWPVFSLLSIGIYLLTKIQARGSHSPVR